MNEPPADHVGQLIALLEAEDGEMVCAAAMVLGRLRPVEDRTVVALGRALEHGRRGARSYVLDALGATLHPDALPIILPFLERPGSLAEQGVHLVRAFGEDAVHAIATRHRDVEGWISGAYVKAAAGIPSPAAVDLVFDRLPAADWTVARATTVCVLRAFEHWPDTVRAALRARLERGLAPGEGSGSQQERITCLNLTSLFAGSMPVDAVERWIGPDQPGAVRRHAIVALGRLDVAADDRARLAPVLRAFLDEDALDAVVRPAIAVLEGWDVEDDADALRALMAARHHVVGEYAVRALARRLGPAAAPELEAALDSPHAGVRLAAAAELAATRPGRERLIAALLGAGHPGAAAEAARVLGRAGVALDGDQEETLREAWLATGPAETPRARTLLAVLCDRDREGANAWIGGLARAAAEAGDAGRAVDLIQPLVRNRLSDADNRFVLAMANLALAGERPDLDDGRFRRAVDLAAPLTRTWGFDFEGAMTGWPRPPAVKLLALATALGRKGTAERVAAGVVHRLIDPAALATEDERDYFSLRDKLAKER